MYEVDVRKVGDESQSGDAITIRYGDFSDRRLHRVVVIDGGFKQTGEELVEHIRTVYGTEHVDLVISTHPDQDHASGLRVVLEELTVGELWMHRPWAHSKAISEFVFKGIAGDLDEMQKRSVATVQDLAAIAADKGVPIVEPFAGTSTADGVIQVLGPTEEFYEELMKDLTDKEKSLARQMYELAKSVVTEALRALKETWDSEALVDPDPQATSPRNNTSTILSVNLDGTGFLFTGDAGVPAFENASWPAGGLSGTLKYLQLPHHGSKRNVGPALLDALLGPKRAEGETTGKYAFISAAKKGAPKHPSRRVVNAAIRRGATVLLTAGSSHCYHSTDAPSRGWGPITPESFTTEYED